MDERRTQKEVAKEGKQITVRLPDDRYTELFALAAITGIAAASIVRSAIFEKLDRMQAERKAAA